MACFRRAAATSGITPPDLPEFAWGAMMGTQEAAAWSSARVSGDCTTVVFGVFRPARAGSSCATPN